MAPRRGLVIRNPTDSRLALGTQALHMRRIERWIIAVPLAGSIACGPTILSIDSGSGTDSEGGGPGDTTVADPIDEPVPPPGSCGEGAGDLTRLWSVEEPDAKRSEAVDVREHRVAWATSNDAQSTLHMLDTAGVEQWRVGPLDARAGASGMSSQGVAIDDFGGVAWAATKESNQGLEAIVFGVDPDGGWHSSVSYQGPDHDLWRAIAMLDGGGAVTVGSTSDQMFVQAYDAALGPTWSDVFEGPDETWAADVDVTADGRILVAVNPPWQPDPIVRSYQSNGVLEWTYVSPDDGVLQTAFEVAVDGRGHAWLAVEIEHVEGRIERFDAAGALQQTHPLDFRPTSIAIGNDGSVWIGSGPAGRTPAEDRIVVEHRTADWELIARYERSGVAVVELALDYACHAYVAVVGVGGETVLEKLR